MAAPVHLGRTETKQDPALTMPRFRKSEACLDVGESVRVSQES